MFIYRAKMHLRHTDATGVLFFPEQFKFTSEAFEEFLIHRGISLKALIDSPYLIPVAHTEADYKAPLQIGDLIEISLQVLKLGTSSVTLHYTLRNEKGIEVGTVQTVHVVIDKQAWKAVPFPDFLRQVFDVK